MEGYDVVALLIQARLETKVGCMLIFAFFSSRLEVGPQSILDLQCTKD